MIFETTDIPGAWVVKPEPYEDARGRFRRVYCTEEFSRAGIPFQIQQTNISENTSRLTLRGFHYRNEWLPEVKFLTCIRGRVYNVIADLRRSSPSFGKSVALELSQQNGWGVYLPHGCAHAFMTLDDDTAIQYYHSSVYKGGADRGLRYNDPFLKVGWPHSPEIISEKDQSYSDFDTAVDGVP